MKTVVEISQEITLIIEIERSYMQLNISSADNYYYYLLASSNITSSLAAASQPRAGVACATVTTHAAPLPVARWSGPAFATAAAACTASCAARYRVQGARIYEDDSAAEGAHEKWYVNIKLNVIKIMVRLSKNIRIFSILSTVIKGNINNKLFINKQR